MKEQKLRIEDALNATRAAVEEGIVAGGGTAYVNAIPAVEKLVAKLQGDEKTGAQIIAKALQAPIRQIAENAGVDGSVVFEKIKSSRKVGYGLFLRPFFEGGHDVPARSGKSAGRRRLSVPMVQHQFLQEVPT